MSGGGTTGGNVNLQSFTLTTGGGTYGGAISGTGSVVKSGAGTLTLTGSNSFTGTVTISAGTLALSGGSAIADGTTVSLANTAGATLQLNGSETIGALSGGGSTGGNVNLQSFTLTTGGANSDTTFGGAISGTGSLVKTGTGRLTLTGTNTYSGTTTISAGTLSVGSMSSGFGTGASAIALSGGALSYTGNNASFTRGLTVSASGGQIETTTAGQTLTLSGGNVAITGTGSFTVGGVGNTAISTNITGTGGGILTKTGTGTLTLSGSNTYSGATNIQNGTLALGVNNGVNQSVAVTLGDATANTNGVLRLNGFSQTVSSLGTTGSGTGNRVTGGSSTLSTLTFNAATSSSFTGILGGSGTDENNLALTKIGNNTLTLSGNNTYSGDTTVSAGTLKIASVLAIPSGTGKGNLSLTGSLDLNGNSITLNGLTGGGGINSSVAGTMNLSVGGNNQTSSYSGVISNGTATALGLIKIGSGALTISGASTFTGGTTIRNGSLILSGNNDRLAPQVPWSSATPRRPASWYWAKEPPETKRSLDSPPPDWAAAWLAQTPRRIRCSRSTSPRATRFPAPSAAREPMKTCLL
jgi:autotransporter-associated beta strand protein